MADLETLIDEVINSVLELPGLLKEEKEATEAAGATLRENVVRSAFRVENPNESDNL